MNKEEVENLQVIMENLGEAYTLLARTNLPSEEYNVINLLLASAKSSLFNFYLKIKTENLKNAYCNGGNSSKEVSIDFIDWISEEGYMRLTKEHGHNWFKIGVVETFTTEELFKQYQTIKIK